MFIRRSAVLATLQMYYWSLQRICFHHWYYNFNDSASQLMLFNPALFGYTFFHVILTCSASRCICKDRTNQVILKLQKTLAGKFENLGVQFGMLGWSRCRVTLRKNISQNMLSITSKQRGSEVDMYLLNVTVFSLILFTYLYSGSIKWKPAWKHSLKIGRALLVYIFLWLLQ